MSTSTGKTKEQVEAEKKAAEAEAQKLSEHEQAEAAKKAAEAEAAAKEEGKAVDGLNIVKALVKAVPNCGYISLNGERITLAKVGSTVSVPECFVKAFPNYLAA